MAVKSETLEKYLVELRRIEEHRTAGAEKAIRRIYKQLLKDLREYVGGEYARLAEDDLLTYEIMQRKSDYASFLEEVEKRINELTPQASAEIKSLTEEVYKLTYQGFVDAVIASKSADELRSAFKDIKIRPEIIKRAVENPVSGLTLSDTLEKNRKEIIYDIKRAVGLGLTNGDRMSTMARRITQAVNGDYTKSIRIARTEAHRVRERGLLDGALETNGVMKQGLTKLRIIKTWQTMQDRRVRPRHRALQGKVVGVEEIFTLPSGAKTACPSGSGSAAEDINCRCYLSYDIEEQK